jgi:hypothetical protein
VADFDHNAPVPYAEVDRIERERDEARAEVERLTIENQRLRKIMEQNTEWREGYAYGYEKGEAAASSREAP